MIHINASVHTKTIDKAWQSWYDLITADMSLDNSRDGSVVGEVINAITVIDDPTRCILKSPIRKLPMRYMVGELFGTYQAVLTSKLFSSIQMLGIE